MEQTKKDSGLSIASLVLGIMSFFIAFIPIVNVLALVMAVLAFIFSFIGIIKKRTVGMAIAGFVLSLLSFVVIITSYTASSQTTSTTNNNSTNSEKSVSVQPQEIHIGEVISGKDSEISIESAQFSQDVEPPVKNMYYTHYQVDDSSNIYLYLILNCKNISTIDLSASSIANITAKYNNNYTYSSFSTIPDDTLGFTYSNLTNIKPLMSQKIYYLIEMPKSIADETDTPIDINIKLDNQTYIYKYR